MFGFYFYKRSRFPYGISVIAKTIFEGFHIVQMEDKLLIECYTIQTMLPHCTY